LEVLFVPVTSLVIGWVKKREPSYGAPAAAMSDTAVTGAA
jgi:hypothetical protein